MRRALILTAVMLFVTSAFAAWNEQVSTDRLTGEKTVRMETPALAPISNYGRTIVPKLVLQCITPSDDGTAAYIGTFIVFGEPVAVADTKMRLRVDDGEVENRIAGISRRGDYFEIVGPDQAIADHLRSSSRLRIEIPLPAGNAFMEFNTNGTGGAIDKTRCPMQLNPR